MSDISFIGSYSGIDRAAIDKLMEIERLPLKQYTTRKASVTEQQNAWKDINTRLNNLFEKIKVLQSGSTFTSMKATSADEKVASIIAKNDAIAGTYKVDVRQLATSTSIITSIPEGSMGADGKFTSDLVGASFTIKSHDGVAHTVTIGEGDGLKELVNKINEGAKAEIDPDTKKAVEGTGTGISASIINGKLVLTDENTGERGMELVAGDGSPEVLEKLGLDNIKIDFSPKLDGEDSEPVDPRIIKGQKSISYVNNVLVENDSNSIADEVVDGLTINLKEVGVTTVTVGLDHDKAEKAIQDFVNQYNSTMKFLEDKLAAGDPEIPGSAGTLAGDGSLMRLHSSLRSMVTARAGAGEGGYTDISQLGVSTIDKHGELKFDAAKLKEALAEDPNKVKNFFFGTDDKGNEVGFVSKVNGYIDSFISKENGILKTKNETYDKTLKDINKKIEAFEARMEKKEEQLIKKFTALDVIMMNAESQMSWLQGQVDAFNGNRR